MSHASRNQTKLWFLPVTQTLGQVALSVAPGATLMWSFHVRHHAALGAELQITLFALLDPYKREPKDSFFCCPNSLQVLNMEVVCVRLDKSALFQYLERFEIVSRLLVIFK